MSASKPSEPTYPRSVTPGIETQRQAITPGMATHDRVELEDGTVWESGPKVPPPGLYVGLDWIRCTGWEGLEPAVESFLSDRFGHEVKESGGAQWFRHGMVWEPGVMLSWGHQRGIIQVDIQGGRLRMLDGVARLELLSGLMDQGLKPTRLDGAVDWIGQDVNLCQRATDSCTRGELCIMRKYRLNDELTAQGYPTRRHLSLGSRESPVCARMYDKGLEQSVAPVGYWERFEVEWKADRAPEVAHLLRETGDDWPKQLIDLVIGAVEFREANGRSELKRRPLAAWWEWLTDGLCGVRISTAQDDPSFSRWYQWFRKSVGPRLLELAETAQVPVADVVQWLLGGVKAGSSGGPIPAQFREAYRQFDTHRQ